MKKAFTWSVLFVAIGCLIFQIGMFIGRNTTSFLPEQSQYSSAVESISETETIRININSATAEQLQTLPGIGEVLAQRIVDYRNEIGSFNSIDQLLKVNGLGDKKLEAILDSICLED